jgi:2-polyprenyl-6-methoxyphenol hydroxylase-like FAD-dependent oxidoreductase
MTISHRAAHHLHNSDVEHVPVLIAGAGPVGLTLALELEHHGIGALLVERNTSTTRHPKMDITNGRSMELFRRLGVADYLRKVAIPADHDTVVTWVTKLSGWELTRFIYPSVDECDAQIRARNDGTDPLEPSMRVSQIVLEPALKEWHETQSRHIGVEYGWQVESFTQDTDAVDVLLRSSETRRTRKIRADYLVGCDGAGSTVRNALGIELDVIDLRRLVATQLGFRRTVGMLARAWAANRERPADGRFYMVHFRSADRELLGRFGTVWHLQSPHGWTLISQDDDDTWTLHCPLGVGDDPERIDPREFLFERLGRPFHCEILVANAWTPRLAVAKSFGQGRVWLAGDAVHQVAPTGGYGMNTGVGDAVGLGWHWPPSCKAGVEPACCRLTRSSVERLRCAIARRPGGTLSSGWRSRRPSGHLFTAKAGTANTAAGDLPVRYPISAISKTKPLVSKSATATAIRPSWPRSQDENPNKT